jgi:hypothetical protein
MLRSLRRPGDMPGSHPIFSWPADHFGARRLNPTSTSNRGFAARPKSPFVNGTGLKPSLTLFLLFMAEPAPAP